MARFLFPALICVALAGCDMASTFKESLDHSREVADAIEKQAGVRPFVGFNYQNGSLTKVTVQFAAIPDKGLPELAKISRSAVLDAFQSEPERLEIAFALAKKP